MRAESAVEPTKVGEHHRHLAALGAVFGSALGAVDVVAASAGEALPLVSARRVAIASRSIRR